MLRLRHGRSAPAPRVCGYTRGLQPNTCSRASSSYQSVPYASYAATLERTAHPNRTPHNATPRNTTTTAMSIHSSAAPSPASDDTVPDPLIWGFNPAGNQGDFARLVPKSPLARRAFSDVVQQMQEDPHWNEHARRFIQFAEHTGSHSDSDATTIVDDGMPSRDVRWYGYYRLNWDIAPARPRLGWILGSSRPDQADAVDLLLTPLPGQFRVAGRHCRLSHNSQSCALLIAADNHRVTVDGIVTLRHNSRVAYRNTGILIHDLAYTLEFTDLDPSISRAQMQKSLHIQYADDRHPSAPVLTPTPNGAVSECGGYVVHAAVAGGSFGAVSYGTHVGTGAPVAIKRVRASAATDYEISLLRSMDHVSRVLLSYPIFILWVDLILR